MSQDDDDLSSGPSLKDLVTATLQSNGVLGKIQAQLRASVFLTLEEDFKEKNLPLVNKRSQELLSSPVGYYAANLVKDFLECLELEYTLAVYEPESNLSTLEDISNNKTSLSNGEYEPSSQTQKRERRPLLFKLIEELHSLKAENKDTFVVSENGKATSSIHLTRHSTSSNQIDDSANSSPAISEKKTITDISKESTSLDTDESESQTHLSGAENDANDKQAYKSKEYSEQSEKTDEEKQSNSDDTTKTLENRSEVIPEGESKSAIEEKSVQKEDEDLSSLSGVKEIPGDEVELPLKEDKDGTLEKDKDEVVEDVAEPAEDIDEDIYVDDLLSSASGTSNTTKDAPESQASFTVDYFESL